MGRPPTKQKKLKDGYYIEVRNLGASSGIMLRRDDEAQMLQAAESYKKTKDVIILGECINGKFAKDKRKTRKKKSIK